MKIIVRIKLLSERLRGKGNDYEEASGTISFTETAFRKIAVL